jgi:hypothetical protein
VEADGRYHERQTALAPYLERLAMPEEGPAALHPAIALDPWERSVLEEALDTDHANGDRWPALLAESVAFQSKYLSETDEMEREEFTSPASLQQQGELWTINAAIGLALMEDIQRVIDATILAGNMGQAKRLTAFRHKVAQIVKTIKGRISAEAYLDAESMHHEMLAHQEQRDQRTPGRLPMLDVHQDEANQPPPSALKEPDLGPPKPIKLNRYANRKLGHEIEIKPDYSKKMLLLLGVAALAWAILILPRMLEEPLAVLTLPDLPQTGAIQEVNARPPSLYVVVDSDGWRAMPSEQRTQWIEEVGQAASAAGYTGVNVRTGEGASVAQWLKQKGARLLTSSGAGS